MHKSILVALLVLPVFGNSQTYLDKLTKEVEAGGYISTSGANPFWIRSNQYGVIPLESQGIFLRTRISAPPRPSGSLIQTPPTEEGTIIPATGGKREGKSLSFNYALEAVANVGKTNRLLIPEAYGALKWKAFELYAGRRQEIVGLVDSTLSSGSYIWSGNALPLPKIQLSISEYTPVIGKGLLSVKGSYTHGWFDDGYVENFYLHQKTFYGRLGKPHWKAKFYGGFNHQVQWGGKPAIPFIEVSPTGEDRLITKYPGGWSAYYQVVTGQSLNKDFNGDALIEEGIPYNEAFNRAGNHLGTVDVGLEILLKSGKLMLYRQSIYEDGSLFYLNNISDGLVGLAFKTNATEYGIKHVVVEYLQTSNQGGGVGSNSTIGQLRGGDNYFNNSLYQNAWTYRGNTIGTPFLTPLSAIKRSSLGYGQSTATVESFIINNRVNALSLILAASGKLCESLSKVTLNRNFGSFESPFDYTNVSIFQQIMFPWKTSYLASISINLDAGKLYGTQVGSFIRVKRKF